MTENLNQKFIFNHRSDDVAVSELSRVNKEVPEKDGIYFVFTSIIKYRKVLEHLVYNIINTSYEFIYFVKVGGFTSGGREIKQKLKGRINNVVGSDFINRGFNAVIE